MMNACTPQQAMRGEERTSGAATINPETASRQSSEEEGINRPPRASAPPSARSSTWHSLAASPAPGSGAIALGSRGPVAHGLLRGLIDLLGR